MRRRVGRPGLVGTMARTAVVAGTATAVAGGVHHHQQQKYETQAEADAYEQQQQMAAQQAAAPAAAAPAAGGALDPAALAQIEQLAQLKASGALTEEEFAAAKAKILGT
jgi:putative oligomerization/nucleic acid binding protein